MELISQSYTGILTLLFLQPLDSAEQNEVVMTRKLWSAHLHPLSSLINDLIKECSGECGASSALHDSNHMTR